MITVFLSWLEGDIEAGATGVFIYLKEVNVAIRVLLLAILFTHFAAASRSAVGTDGVIEPSRTVSPLSLEQLTLSTSLISRRFCEGDDEVGVMQAKLKLQYQNKGSQPVMLSKRSVVVSSLIVSRTSSDATAGKREETIDFHGAFGEQLIAPQNFDTEFAVISAGESYYAETMVPVVFLLTSKAVAGAVAPGQHVLQVQINTFPTAGRLREYGEQVARQKGYSWRDYVVSEPMTFEIEATPKLERCN